MTKTKTTNPEIKKIKVIEQSSEHILPVQRKMAETALNDLVVVVDLNDEKSKHRQEYNHRIQDHASAAARKGRWAEDYIGKTPQQKRIQEIHEAALRDYKDSLSPEDLEEQADLEDQADAMLGEQSIDKKEGLHPKVVFSTETILPYGYVDDDDEENEIEPEESLIVTGGKQLSDSLRSAIEGSIRRDRYETKGPDEDLDDYIFDGINVKYGRPNQ